MATRGPELGVDYDSRMEGGVFGAMARAKERKRATLAREAQERAARKERLQLRAAQQQQHIAGPAALTQSSAPGVLPGVQTGVTPHAASAAASSDRSLAPLEVAALLSDLNGGTPPALDELMPVLVQCGADPAGMLPAKQLTSVVVLWNRRVRERGLPGLGSGHQARSSGSAAPAPAQASGGSCGCCSIS